MAIVAVAVAAVSAVVDAAFASAVLHLSEFTSGVSPAIFFSWTQLLSPSPRVQGH